MKHEEIKELSNYLNFKEIPQYENAVTYGEHGETYFIILKGVCGVQVPNHAQFHRRQVLEHEHPSDSEGTKESTIDNWHDARKHYLSLLEWKEHVFDPKVVRARREARAAFV